LSRLVTIRKKMKRADILRSLGLDRLYSYVEETQTTDTVEAKEETYIEIEERCMACEHAFNDVDDMYIFCQDGHAYCSECCFQWFYSNHWIQYDFTAQTWSLTKYYEQRKETNMCPMCQLLDQRPDLLPIVESIYVSWTESQGTISYSYFVPKEQLAELLDHWTVGDLVPYRVYHYKKCQESSEELSKDVSYEYYWVGLVSMDVVDEDSKLSRPTEPDILKKKKYYKAYYDDEHSHLVVPYWLCQYMGYTYFMESPQYNQIPLCMELQPNPLEHAKKEYLYWSPGMKDSNWIEPEYFETFEDAYKESDEQAEYDTKEKHIGHVVFNEDEDTHEIVYEHPELSECTIGTLRWSEEEQELMIWNGQSTWETIDDGPDALTYPHQLIQIKPLNYYVYYIREYGKQMDILLSPTEKICLPSLQIKSIYETA
jgi:hypothetical protein